MSAVRFSVETVPLDRRRAAWLERLAQLGLQASGASGTIAVSPSSSGALLADLAGEAQALESVAHGPGAPMLLLLVGRGRARLTAGRTALELADGDLVALEMSTAWQMHWRTDFRAVLLRLQRGPLAARLGRVPVRLPVVLGRTVAAAAARPLLRTLAADIENLGQADLAAGEIALTELVASALLGEANAPDGGLTQVQAAHFRRVSAAIDSQLTNADLGLTDIARQEGMSARYLQRLFEGRGENFSDHVRQLRLQRCKVDLLDPNHARESVAAIGQRWGFRDQAHFSRAFSTAFRMTPTEMRRAAVPVDDGYSQRGRPTTHQPVPPAKTPPAGPQEATRPEPEPWPGDRHHLPATADTVHWGYVSRTLPPVLRVEPGATVTIETLTQHSGDDWDRMVAGDAGAESVFGWTSEGKNIDRRGAGPMNASVFGRGAGEGFGVHICTGPIYVRGAEPGDVIEVEIIDIRPRPSGNPLHTGKAFASNASAWWGYQYGDLLDRAKRETVTIFEIDLERPQEARPLYSYVWQPQADPFGVVHKTMDYPGVPVDHTLVEHRTVLEGIAIPARLHFGFVALAPRESELVDSIPPSYFGGNIDNWRAGKGSRIYLPVSVEGGLLSMGDGHFALSDGEINGTGLECSLTGDIRIRLHKAGAADAAACVTGLKAPLIETRDSWVIQSFSHLNYLRDLGRNAQAEVYQKSTVDLALRNAFRQTRRFLMDVYGLNEDEALTIMSLAVDFGVTQVADGNFGVHAVIDKAIFRGRSMR